MNIKMLQRTSGYTYVEILVAITIGVVVYLFFIQGLQLLLRLRDEHQAKQDITRTAQLITHILDQTGQTSNRLDVGGGNTELLVTGDPCRLLRYNISTESLEYAEDVSPDCTPPESPTMNLNPSSVNVTELNFLPLPQASDAKSVQLTLTLESIRPFGENTSSFQTTVSLWNK